MRYFTHMLLVSNSLLKFCMQICPTVQSHWWSNLVYTICLHYTVYGQDSILLGIKNWFPEWKGLMAKGNFLYWWCLTPMRISAVSVRISDLTADQDKDCASFSIKKNVSRITRCFLKYFVYNYTRLVFAQSSHFASGFSRDYL